MQWPGLRDWLFGIRTFLAAMLALYIALALDLERPYWAMASAYIAAQPLSGATRSKALFRLYGTVIGAAAAVPTLWIVLGPLGQSITATHNLGEAAPQLLPAPYGTAFHALGLVYGLPVWGFAMLWAALALADLELDRLALAEHSRPRVADDLGGVHEQVVAAVLEGQEPEAPLGVEPADSPLRHESSTVESGQGPQSR